MADVRVDVVSGTVTVEKPSQVVNVVAAGPQGPQGEVAVDSTVTGAAGTQALVEDLDPSPNKALLRFTIPQGSQGVPGDLTQKVADQRYENRMLTKAVAWYDAKNLGASSDRLLDLSGNGRDAVFGAGAAKPVVLPYDGEAYLHLPGKQNYAAVATSPYGPSGTASMIWDGVAVTDTNDASILAAWDGWILYFTPDRQVYCSSPPGYTYANLTAPDVLSLGRRYVIEVRHDFATHTTAIHIDGAQVASKAQTGTPVASAGSGAVVGTWITTTVQQVHSHRAAFTQDGATVAELLPANASADYTTIANTGTAGGNWTISRAASGYKTVVVDRPLLLFGGAQTATAESPYAPENTVLVAYRVFGDPNVDDYHFLLQLGAGFWSGTTIYRAQGGVLAYRVNPDANMTWIEGAPTGQHVAAGTVSPSLISLHLDGALANQQAIAVPVSNPEEVAVIGGNSDMEFIAAAIFDRALTDAEVAQASAELLGTPHAAQTDPHKAYPPLVAGTTAALLPVGAREGTIAILTDNTIAIRTRTGGWRAVTTTALTGSPP